MSCVNNNNNNNTHSHTHLVKYALRIKLLQKHYNSNINVLPRDYQVFRTQIENKFLKNMPCDFIKNINELWNTNMFSIKYQQDRFFCNMSTAYNLINYFNMKIDVYYFSEIIDTYSVKYILLSNDWKIEIPRNWYCPQTNYIEIFDIDKKSQEYDSIFNMFNDDMIDLQPEITQIIRVQNIPQYMDYFEETAFLLNHHANDFHSNDNLNTLNKKLLFHGTRRINPLLIIKQMRGFDVRLSSKNNHLGYGCYFAENARYSHNYSYYNKNEGYYEMILSWVLLGDVFDYGMLHNPNLTDMPLNIETKKRYDSASTISIIGGIKYLVYCIKNGKRAYASYIIRYNIKDFPQQHVAWQSIRQPIQPLIPTSPTSPKSIDDIESSESTETTEPFVNETMADSSNDNSDDICIDLNSRE